MHMNRDSLYAQLLIIIILIHYVKCLEECPDGYIQRLTWPTRKKFKKICCMKLKKNCTPGFYVKTCKVNLTKDECQPCPADTWLADETNSTSHHQCIVYSCNTGAIRVTYLPETGCRLPCKCDTSRNYYGFDSCNCKLHEGSCPIGTTLALNGSCLLLSDAERMNDLKRDTNGTNIHKPGKSDKSQRIAITIASVLGLVVVLVGVCLVCRCCKLKNKEELDTSDAPSTPSLPHSDSGISSSSAPSSVAIEIQNVADHISIDTAIGEEEQQLTEPEIKASHLEPLLQSTPKKVAKVLPMRQDQTLQKEEIPLLQQPVTSGQVDLNQEMPQVSSIDENFHFRRSPNEVLVQRMSYAELTNVHHSFGSPLIMSRD